MTRIELDDNTVWVVMCLCATLVFTTCGGGVIAERWGGAEYQVQKACVYKTGNPDCRPNGAKP